MNPLTPQIVDKIKGKTWIITDTHFGHANMVQYCGRPEDFSNTIFNNLFKMIQPNDLLIHLGDICIGNDSLWHERLSVIDCKKVLVRGNHDKKSDNWYMTHGWDFVCDNFSTTFLGKKILFSHMPRPVQLYDFNIHGHFHNDLHRLLDRQWVVPDEEERNKEVLETLTKNHINISIEETNYKPVLLDTIIKKGIEL
jgi:calcineurin-like phosphoesterase family protein